MVSDEYSRGVTGDGYRAVGFADPGHFNLRVDIHIGEKSFDEFLCGVVSAAS